MDRNAKEMDTATLAKFSKIFLKHQILWHINKYKYWAWGRTSFQPVFKEITAIFPMEKYHLNDIHEICNKFRDDHLSTIVEMIVSYIKMRHDVYEKLLKAPEWLWWLRNEMQEIPVHNNVLKITEFQRKFANSMWQVMVKMYGVTEPSIGESSSSVASGDLNLNCENRTMREDREISIEHIDRTPLVCLMKEYTITTKKLQEIWCGWREVVVAKLSAMSRGDLGMSPLRSVDWSLADQLLLFDSQLPTLIQEDFEPIVNCLKILFHLVTKHQVEECDPMERKSRWDMLHREYNSSNSVGQKASCVLLQRWWYELKLSTQRAFRKLWQSLKNNGKHRNTPLPEKLQCDIALRYRHLVTGELPTWTELVRSGEVVVLVGINGGSAKGGQDRTSVRPIYINNSVLHNDRVPMVDTARQSTRDNVYDLQIRTKDTLSNQKNNDLVTLKRVNSVETEGGPGCNENKNNSEQNVLDFLNKVNPAEVEIEITFESDDEDTTSGNNTDDNINDNMIITTKDLNHDDGLMRLNDEGLPTLETAYGEDRQDPCKDMKANGESNYVFSKRLFENLIKIINSKNPKYYIHIKFERKKWRKQSDSDTPSSNSDSDSDSSGDSESQSDSDNDSYIYVSDSSNGSEDTAEFKYSTNQLLMDAKVILTKLDYISVWRENSYTAIDDNDQFLRIDLNSKVLSGLTSCSNANYNCVGERKRKYKKMSEPNKRRRIDSESSVEEVKCLDDKMDDPKEEKNGRVAKKIKLQDIDEIRRINKDILTAQVAPMTVNKAQTVDDSSNKNVDESTKNMSTDEPKIVNIDPELGNTSKENYIDLTKEDEKPNIGYLLCGGNTQDILRFLSKKKEGLKKNGKVPSVRALLKLIEYLNVLYGRRLPSCCQARRARSIVLAHRRILASKNPARPAPAYRRFAQQHKLLHGKNACTCCCKRVLIEPPPPTENYYLTVLSRIGSILGNAANGEGLLSSDGIFKTLRDFARTFSKTKNIQIGNVQLYKCIKYEDSEESKGPIVEAPKEIINKKQSLPHAVDSTPNFNEQSNENINKKPMNSSENVKENQSLPRPVDSKKNCKKKKVNLNNANDHKSSNKLDTTDKSFDDSYKAWVTEKNKCNLLFGYKVRNKTDKNTAKESKETQSNGNSKSSVEYQTMKRFTIVDGVACPIQTENSEREAIHENLNTDFQVPLDRSINKLGDKSNVEKSKNEAVNSKKSTIDYEVASGVNWNLGNESSGPKSIDKIPTKSLKVRSLEELNGIKTVISSDLARSDESKTKESEEQQLNTIDKEVINKSQPYMIILNPTVSNNSISQFNNEAPVSIFMSKTLNFEVNQPSTSTQLVQNEAKNSKREAIHENLNKDFQVPHDRSINKLGDKSNVEKSKNKAVNYKKNIKKSTDKIPIKRLKVRSLEELNGMKPGISSDLARSDESKTKESIEQQLNTIDKEVINESQPYIITSEPTVSNHSISQFNNGPTGLIYMPKTLNFEIYQTSTSTQSVQNEAKNPEAIHENLIKYVQVPLDRSINKLGDKSNVEKSKNKAVNSKKITKKSTDKIPIKRLKVRSLEELNAMKAVISSDLARSDEFKTKESIEQQLNTIHKEVINESQPYIITSEPTVSNHSISQFNNGPTGLIYMPETLNFEANQPSTSTQSVQNEIINNGLDSIQILNVMSLQDHSKFNGLSKAPPMSPEQYIVGKDTAKINILCMDISKPVWKLGDHYLVVTHSPHIFERIRFFTMCPGAQAELVVDSRTSLLEDKTGGLYSAPEQIIIDGKVLQKIISSPLIYATVLFVVPSEAQCKKLLHETASLFLYGLRDGELHQVRRTRTVNDRHMIYCRKREAASALVYQLNLNKVIQVDSD